MSLDISNQGVGGACVHGRAQVVSNPALYILWFGPPSHFRAIFQQYKNWQMDEDSTRMMT